MFFITKTNVTAAGHQWHRGIWREGQRFRQIPFLDPKMGTDPHDKTTLLQQIQARSPAYLFHSNLLYCLLHVPYLCSPGTPKQWPLNMTPSHIPVPLYRLFSLPGKPHFLLSPSSYTYLQELAKYQLFHGHFSDSIPSHIPSRKYHFLLCNVALLTECQAGLPSPPLSAVCSWMSYLISLCFNFFNCVMRIITIIILSHIKL